jgi:hypothetical protein
MVDGIHVDPVEWWDPKWVADHITEKLKSFENPATAAGSPPAGAPRTEIPHRGRRRR